MSKTFDEASIFAKFLIQLSWSSFTALMDLPELSEISDWSENRLRYTTDFQSKLFEFHRIFSGNLSAELYDFDYPSHLQPILFWQPLVSTVLV